MLGLFALLAPCHAYAQNISARSIESVDVRTLNADTVVVGKLVTVMSKSGRAVAVLDVEETLTGTTPKIHQVPLPAFGDSRDIRKIYEQNKTSRLLFIGSTFTLLDDKNPEFPLLGGARVSGAAQVLPYIREVIRTHPNWNKTQTTNVDRLIVPIDARLEKWAIEAVASTQDVGDRHQAVQALRYFKSDANIALMKSLLNDLASSIRQAAEENLRRWGVPVN